MPQWAQPWPQSVHHEPKGGGMWPQARQKWPKGVVMRPKESYWETQAGELLVREVICSNIIPLIRNERSYITI